MMAQVARFELKYQIKSPIFWITTITFLLLTAALSSANDLRIGWGGYVARNSPYTIGLMCMLMGVFAIFIPASFVSNVVLRDDETGFGPIIHTTRLSKRDYLFGRFTGAFAASCLAFLSVPIGAWLGAAMPWLDPQTVGPFRPGVYLYAYLVLCVPTMFILGAGLFALATTTRSMLTTYLVAIVVLMLYLLTASYVARADWADLAALLDPFGLSAYGRTTRSWTPNDRNTLLPPMTGPLLRNRVLWLSLALALLGVAWRSFRAGAHVDARRRQLKTEAESAEPAPRPRSGSLPRPASSGRALGWGPLVALTAFDTRAVLRSPAYIILLGIGLMNAVVGLWIAGDDTVSITLPVTRVMIMTLIAQFTLMPQVIAAYYAGELVWRDRERRVHEIVDATPAADWAFVLPKVVAIATVLFTMALVSVIAAVGVQAIKGYFNFELSHYFTWYVAPWVVDLLLYAVLAVFIQMLVPHKYGGLLVTLLVLAAQLTLTKFGFEHHLYQYATSSAVPLSDMNGQGEFAKHAAWFRVYWMAAATMLCVLAYALWRRGATSPLRGRLRRLPTRLKGPVGLTFAGAAVVMAGVGGFIYYNTNVLNEYRTFIDGNEWSANYEKTLLGFEKVPEPRIVDIKLDVAIYPNVPKVTTRGRYIVENKTKEPLKEVHVWWMRSLETRSFLGTLVQGELTMKSLEIPGARLTKEFPDFHYRIYTFDRPLAPGERTEVRFETERGQVGFRNSNNETNIVPNGTFVSNFEIAPFLGPSRYVILADQATRRKFGLPDELRPATLEDSTARGNQYFRSDSDWIMADVTVSTEADQVIVAPGHQVDTKVEDGRRISHFTTEAPIHNFFSIQSARYAVREDHWKDVSLAVYYHPAHEYNVDRMLKAMKASLEYYTVNFSPYQFRQLRIVEFPAYRNFAQAFPGTVPYSEAAGFILNLSDPNRLDGVTYVTAHEAGHQWWAHQVIGADVQGQTVLSETLAQYSALMVMERIYGLPEIRRFLRGSLNGYLRERGTDLVGEVPLERVENQAHIRYQKGGMVMYLLKDLMGEEAVNRALRALIRDFAFKGPPYPTSRDLIQRLRAEAGPDIQPLISDLFEKITVFDLKVTGARLSQLADGKWSVAIDLEARKSYADAKGLETEAPLDGQFDIGVFTSEPGKPGFAADSVLFLERRRIGTGAQTVTVVVDRQPRFVGFDPYNKYVDRNSDDNVRAVAPQ